MSTIAFDLDHPELLAHEVEEANRRLSRESEVPASILALVRDLGEQIADTESSQLGAVDPYLWIELQAGALKTLTAIQDGDPRDERREVRVGLERIRFLLTRIAERAGVSEDRPSKEIVQWLDAVLDVPQRQKSQLLGVAERTYQRWISPTDTSAPEGEHEHAVRLVARVAAQLRHSLGGAGIVDWLRYPRAELDGVTPLQRLLDPTGPERVLALALATRGPSAA